MNDAILRVDDIQKYYGNKGSLTKAVDHISFTVDKGEFRDHGAVRLWQDHPAQLHFYD